MPRGPRRPGSTRPPGRHRAGSPRWSRSSPTWWAASRASRRPRATASTRRWTPGPAAGRPASSALRRVRRRRARADGAARAGAHVDDQRRSAREPEDETPWLPSGGAPGAPAGTGRPTGLLRPTDEPLASAWHLADVTAFVGRFTWDETLVGGGSKTSYHVVIEASLRQTRPPSPSSRAAATRRAGTGSRPSPSPGAPTPATGTARSARTLARTPGTHCPMRPPTGTATGEPGLPDRAPRLRADRGFAGRPRPPAWSVCVRP